MTRVSLTEDYDDRSVISKLNKMSDIVNANTAKCDSAVTSAEASAQSAQRTADTFAGSVGAVVAEAKADIASSKAQVDEAKAQVDEAKAEADATVTTVAQAVQTANSASATATQAAGQVTDKVAKTGTSTPQVISGTGGLQIAGDLSVGTDFQVSGDTHLGDQMEVAGMSIEVNGFSTTLSNADGITVNGHNLNNVATTNESNHFTKDQYFDTWAVYAPNQVRFKGTAPDGWKRITNIASDGTDRAIMQFNQTDTYLSGDNVYRSSKVPDNANSRSIVDKAYVESTDGSTNNLVHRTANESIDGIKQHNEGVWGKRINTSLGNVGYWIKLMEWNWNITQTVKFRFSDFVNAKSSAFVDGVVFTNGTHTNTGLYARKLGEGTISEDYFHITVDNDGKCGVWYFLPAYHSMAFSMEYAQNWSDTFAVNVNVSRQTTEPVWSTFDSDRKVVWQ